MRKFKKKPVIVEAIQWFKNGDHPEDSCYWIDDKSPERFLSEGKVVRYFRDPDEAFQGSKVCKRCAHTYHEHGHIETLEGGHIVCVGDWIIKGIEGEYYPCKPEIFKATYEEVLEQ